VVNPLIGFGLFLYLPRPISKVNWENPPAGAPQVDELLLPVRFNSRGESGNPPHAYPLMVAVEQKPVAGVANARGTTGSSSWAIHLPFGNQSIKSLDNMILLLRRQLAASTAPRCSGIGGDVTEFRLDDPDPTTRSPLAVAGGAAGRGAGSLPVWLARRKYEFENPGIWF